MRTLGALVMWTSLAGVAVSTFVAGGAQAAEASSASSSMTDYVVKKGDTCTSVTKQFYGDPKLVHLLHDANPTLGPPPHTLKEGSILHLPPKPVAAPDARVSFVRNEVNAYTPESHAAKPDDPLMRGHRVDTQADSSAEVTFADATRLQLGEHTLVVILGSGAAHATKAATDADTTLLTGTLRAHLAELAGGKPSTPVAIATGGGGKVLIDSGDVLLNVDEAQTSRLAVYRGSSALRNSGKVTAVHEGFGSKAEKNKPPTPPKPLPPAPTWSTPPAAFAFATPEGARVVGTYAAGSGAGPAAAAWHVQLGRDERFNDLVVDAHVAVDVTKLEAKQLPAGDYFARVSAIDADKFEGKPSAAARVVIAARPAVAPAPKGQLGSLALPPSMFCGLDGAPLARVEAPASISISRARAHVLRCAATADGEASETPIAVSAIGEVHVTATLLASDVATRSGRVALHVTDGEGAPIAGAAVKGHTDAGATLGELTESKTPGTYEAPITWATTTLAFVVRASLNDLDTADAAPVATPREERKEIASVSPWSGELGVFGGIGVVGDGRGAGPRVGADMGARRSFGHWSLGLAFRPEYEHHGQDANGTCGPTPSPTAAPCGFLQGTSYAYHLSDDLLTLGFPITARLGAPEATLAPYLGLAPGVLVDRSTLSTRGSLRSFSQGDTDARFTLHAFLGAQLHTGPGGFFLEAGYRWTPEVDGMAGTAQFSGFLGSLGYRLTL